MDKEVTVFDCIKNEEGLEFLDAIEIGLNLSEYSSSAEENSEE
ncbi:hypothetical protein VIBC2010_05394 [Vibrio caribbeanicus ATCC BAA-2122]|jgi:hypothetical protein|uniref:Uncharacterized protein n=1 Tax=Vibrio caribbeanicus ATCC BAA-2122 TaxID=796620 RepID=E3BKJ6_9VIBR|nr:hypothetical protein VIBC2010_05394 [Vibrio caribbeanicus ATCC BAA-2122]